MLDEILAPVLAAPFALMVIDEISVPCAFTNLRYLSAPACMMLPVSFTDVVTADVNVTKYCTEVVAAFAGTVTLIDTLYSALAPGSPAGVTVILFVPVIVTGDPFMEILLIVGVCEEYPVGASTLAMNDLVLDLNVTLTSPPFLEIEPVEVISINSAAPLCVILSVLLETVELLVSFAEIVLLLEFRPVFSVALIFSVAFPVPESGVMVIKSKVILY